jgi:hypothetical protein
MFNYGYHFGMIFLNLLGIVLFFAWLILAIYTLFALKKSKISPTAAGVWALVITAIPVLGSLAFLIVSPHDDSAGE